MRKFKKCVLALLSATMIITASCSVYASGMEGLSEMQEETTTDTTTGLNAGDSSSTETVEKTDGEDTMYNARQLDTGNAIDDILNNERYAGAMHSITKVTDLVDKWFIVIISVVAFFIISAAMLKNVCAGAYVANPRFWDMVHDAHDKMKEVSINSLKSKGAGIVLDANVTNVRDVLLVIVPDIKAFTDFTDQNASDIDPKKYFSKSIPQMLLCVIIGIFIYNGYYRDTAAKVGAFGAESFERFIGEADPVALADRIYNTTGKPKTKYDNGKSLQHKLGKQLADRTYSLYVSTYHDLTGAGTKSQLMSKIVLDVDEMLNEASPYLKENDRTSTGYEYSFTVDVSKAAASDVAGMHTDSATQGNTVTLVWVKRLISNDVLGIHYTDIEEATTGMTAVRYAVTFTKNTDKLDAGVEGWITITMNPEDYKNGIAKDEVNKQLNAAGYDALSKGLGTTVNGSNLAGSKLVVTDGDGKSHAYGIKVVQSDSQAKKTIGVGKPEKNN